MWSPDVSSSHTLLKFSSVNTSDCIKLSHRYVNIVVLVCLVHVHAKNQPKTCSFAIDMTFNRAHNMYPSIDVIVNREQVFTIHALTLLWTERIYPCIDVIVNSHQRVEEDHNRFALSIVVSWFAINACPWNRNQSIAYNEALYSIQYLNAQQK